MRGLALPAPVPRRTGIDQSDAGVKAVARDATTDVDAALVSRPRPAVVSESFPSARNKRNRIRHAHTTALLKAGIHLKIVSERLGHSGIQITADTYSHVTPDMQRESIGGVDTALFG